MLAPYRIYSESTLCWGQSHLLCELQIIIIEDPTDGDISIRCNAGQDHRCTSCDSGVSDLHKGLCHILCEETEENTK